MVESSQPSDSSSAQRVTQLVKYGYSLLDKVPSPFHFQFSPQIIDAHVDNDFARIFADIAESLKSVNGPA